MEMNVIVMIVAGLVFLVVGGELLIRGATRIAEWAGVSSLVIGLTVVAFGTSTPELVVSIKAGLSGNPNIAVANVVGSNIFNVLFILGICAMMLPLKVSSQLVRFDVPIMIFASLLTYALAWNGVLGPIEGVVLVLLLVAYTTFMIWKSRSESKAVKAEFEGHYHAEQHAKEEAGQSATVRILTSLGYIAVGLVILIFGARWLVDGAVSLAKSFGVSDTVIGLTIVAAGTSLPEVAASVIATIKGERDIAIGNVVGSNIYNIFGILGVSSIVTPGGLLVAPEMFAFDIPVMIAVAVACLPIFFSGFSISRWEGALFLFSYVAYTTFIVLKAMKHAELEYFQQGMYFFALPLLVLTLGVILWQSLQQVRKKELPAPKN
jgi:cation:H+ antiporter